MIRTARPGEEAAIRGILEQTYHDSKEFNDLLFTYLYDPKRTVVAEEQGEVVAVVQSPEVVLRYRGQEEPMLVPYATAVRADKHNLGLGKRVMAEQLNYAREWGYRKLITFINLTAVKPWQSIGYAPAFPMHYRREARAEGARAVSARRVRWSDGTKVQELDALYERKFTGYAHWVRRPEDWLKIFVEYSLSGDVWVTERDDHITGYAVCDLRDGDLNILECACEEPENEAPLRQQMLRNYEVDYAIAHEAMTEQNRAECIASGITQRVAPGGLPDFPYEAGYLNLFHQ